MYWRKWQWLLDVLENLEDVSMATQGAQFDGVGTETLREFT